MRINALGIDPSLSNLGMARCWIDLDTLEIGVDDLILVHTETDKTKTVIKTADNWRRAVELRAGMLAAAQGCSIAMVEIPLMITPSPGMPGGPAAASVANHNSGIAIGIVAGCPLPVIPVMPDEPKVQAVGSRRASKEEMIAWAVNKYPNAPWKTRMYRGKRELTKDNEHLADAVAIVNAGIRTNAFRHAVAMLRGLQGVAA